MDTPDNGFRSRRRPRPLSDKPFSSVPPPRRTGRRIGTPTRPRFARIADREQRASKRWREPTFQRLPLRERTYQQRAVAGRFMQIFRTDANPSHADLSIERRQIERGGKIVFCRSGP